MILILDSVLKAIISIIRSSLYRFSKPTYVTVIHRALFRWICGFKPFDDPQMAGLHSKFGLLDLTEIISKRRMRYFVMSSVPLAKSIE